jgi:hypothetical protein
MRKERYLDYSQNKSNYLSDRKKFYSSELSNERLFRKFLKDFQFQIEEVVPNKMGEGVGAIVYTPDYFAVDNFEKFRHWDSFTNPYFKDPIEFPFEGSTETPKIYFFSEINVNGNDLEGFELRLRDSLLTAKGYDEILVGKFSHQYGYSKQENDENVLKVKERINFFREKGMKENLLDELNKYLLARAEGYDPDERDERL